MTASNDVVHAGRIGALLNSGASPTEVVQDMVTAPYSREFGMDDKIWGYLNRGMGNARLSSGCYYSTEEVWPDAEGQLIWCNLSTSKSTLVLQQFIASPWSISKVKFLL